MKSISIDENGVWAGTGTLEDGGIYDCPATLGSGDSAFSDSAYREIELAIEHGEDSVTLGDYTWTWDIAE